MLDRPLLMVVIAVSTYWTGVLVMVLLARRCGAPSAGLLPTELGERALWLIWVPVIICWIAFPLLAMTQDDPPWVLPGYANKPGFQLLPPAIFHHPAYLALRWIAGIGTLACLALTIACWARMGRNWRIGVVPDDHAQLVTTGAYRYVRHPIYALSVALMVGTAIVAPIWPIILIAILHITFMNLKARNEERFLKNLHGDRYIQYMRHTGRFLPRRHLKA